jgi:glyoxylase-like metal-dependent hydrolase (beta-lactamase superfamily II)
VYASWPTLPSAHATLATGRPATAFPGPVLHRLDCTSFRWRLRKVGLGRKIDIFRDARWVEPLPIYAYLIEHPEGLFLVDTGDTWRNSVPGYLPWWNPFFTTQVSIKVAPLEEIGPRLHALGINPAPDIAAVILTHFHHDHTGGLDHFPHTRIIARLRGAA